MNLCSNGHDEVCYEVRKCPAYGATRERDLANEEIVRLEGELGAIIEDRTLVRYARQCDSRGEGINTMERIEVQICWPGGGEPKVLADVYAAIDSPWTLIPKEMKEKPNDGV